jgi:hypothetical protein
MSASEGKTEAEIILGSFHGGRSGILKLRNNVGKDSVILDGNSGDIILANADCAEDLDFCGPDKIEPGTVVVIEGEGNMIMSTKAYDKRVAGVVSGAGGYKPGIILDKMGSKENRRPVALMGKVYCKVDADPSPIEVGDLLTTSSKAGYAMKAVDQFKAFGAIIGKALNSLNQGQGLIPILVTLQ